MGKCDHCGKQITPPPTFGPAYCTSDCMIRAERYRDLVHATRSAPGWKPYGEPDCGDCQTMSHCETHFKLDGRYPVQVSTSAKEKP